jgi:hypothetical protein
MGASLGVFAEDARVHLGAVGLELFVSVHGMSIGARGVRGYAGVVEKTQLAHPAHQQAALRWVEMTIAHTMVFRNDTLDKETRRRTTTEIIGRWRGNRGTEWQPTIGDLDRLYEATVQWVIRHAGVNLFE